MNNITKRLLITHDIRWYWKSPKLRRQIREISEDRSITPPEQFVRLPLVSQDDILKAIASEPDKITSQVLAECTLYELEKLYRAVFQNDEAARIQVDVSPLTDKIGRNILPYTGVMAVFCLADSLMKSEVTAAFSEEELQRLGWLRCIAARRLHAFTKRLTRINADANPVYGMCVNNNVAQVYVVNQGRPGEKELQVAQRAYSGKIPTQWCKAVIRSTSIELKPLARLPA